MAYLTASDITVTLDPRDRHILGKIKMSEGSITFGDGALTYPTNGIPMPAIGNFGMNKEVVALAIVDDSAEGLVYRYNQANRKIKIFTSSAFTGSALATHIHAAITAGTPAGTVAAPVFTGTSPVSSLDLGTPAFSGTGLTAAAQVITTTDNQTMTENQCAGMWLISVTQTIVPNLILSNTAVTGAPAVLTVQGLAVTDAGTYKIVKSLTPIGTVAAPAFTGSALATHQHAAITAGTPVGTNAVSPELADATAVAATTLKFMVWGK